MRNWWASPSDFVMIIEQIFGGIELETENYSHKPIDIE